MLDAVNKKYKMGKDLLQSSFNTCFSSLDFNALIQACNFDALIQASEFGLAAVVIIAPLISYYNYSRLVQQDLNRIAEGLPTEVEITPEEIIDNPELEEIYGAAADDGFLVFLLESHEQYLRNQQIADFLLNYIDNLPQADQLWTLYSYIEPILDALF